MKILNETETRYMRTEEETMELFDRIDSNSIWARVYTKELTAIGLDRAPLFISQLRTCNNFDPSVTDDSIVEAMENVNLAVKVPLDSSGFVSFPLGPTALSGIIQRAGYGIDSQSIRRSKETLGRTVMEPTKKAMALNFGLQIQNDQSLVFILDEKVRACHSGDSLDYSRLPFSELVSILKDGLRKQFSDVFFSGASADYLYYSSTYVIKDESLNNQVREVLESSGVDTNGMYTSVKLISSDTGNAGANIYPYMQGGTRYMAIGRPITLTHKNGHSLDDFEENVGMVVSMFKDSKEKLEQMGLTKVKHPSGMLLRIAKQCGLSKRISCEEAPAFEGMFGSSATQLDVWWQLNDIYTEMCNSDKLTESRKISLQESIARICFADMAEYDMPYQWD